MLRDPRGRPDLRPADGAAPGRDVPARRHARAARALGSTACARTGRTWTPPSRSSARAARAAVTARPDRHRADDRASSKRLLATPLDQAVIPVDGPRRVGRRPRTRSRGRPRRRPPGRPGLPRALLEASTSRRRARSRASCRRPTAMRLYRHSIRSLDDARPGARGRAPDRAGGARVDRRGAPGPRAAKPASATTSTRYRAALATTRRTTPASRRGAASRARRGHRAGRRRRAAVVRPDCRGLRASVRPVEQFKEKDAPFAYYYPPTLDGSRPGIYYVNTYDLPSRARTSSSRARRTTRRSRATTSRSRSRWSTRRSTCSAGWAAPRRRRVRRGLGPVRRTARRRAGPVPQRRRAAGMLDAQAWRAARLIVDSGMHGLGWSRQQSIDWLLKTGPVRHRRDDRDRPLHRVAGPGAHVHDRDARDPPAAPASSRQRDGDRVRHQARSTTSSSATARCRW